MQAVKRILVVIDPSQQEQVALTRASLIAGFIECELHLLVCEDRQDYSDLLARLRVEQDARTGTTTSPTPFVARLPVRAAIWWSSSTAPTIRCARRC